MTSALIRQLLDAGVHFGHQTKRWNPKMKPFIFGSRAGIYIIDLEKTERHLQAARDFLEETAASGQQVLYVGTKKQAKTLLEQEAKRAGMPYVITRWLGGTLTNFQTIKRNIDQLLELRKQREEGFFERISKKDAKQLGRQQERLEENFAGVATMTRLPGCVFVVDTKREQIAVREANRLNLPVVAICDTNSDPDLVQWPIPGNDDAIRSLTLLIAMLTDSILAGRQRYLSQQPVAPIAPAAEASDAEAAPAEKADAAS